MKPLITQTRVEVLVAEHCRVAFLPTGVVTYSRFPPPGSTIILLQTIIYYSYIVLPLSMANAICML